MLRTFRDLSNYTFAAPDGEIGIIHDFYFDDVEWQVRYFVVVTGAWSSGQPALIATDLLDAVDPARKTVFIRANREQLRRASRPDIHPLEPQKGGRTLQSRVNGADSVTAAEWGRVTPPSLVMGRDDDDLTAAPPANSRSDDTHLHAGGEIARRYAGCCPDGNIGTVYDFVLNDVDWTVRYLVIRSGLWPFAKETLLPTNHIEEISATAREIRLDVPRRAIKDAPPFDEDRQITKLNEQQLRYLYRHHRDRYHSALHQ
ncbi:MAG TPA: PRC-barrel domain-containing protein [Chthoniobacterales bacterium]|nr:PRC-barrel domain-containing protein [Chthoniobacterales bacterium]